MSDHLSWSIRLSRDEVGEQLFEQQLAFVAELLGEHFPEDCGYEVDGVRLSGPIEGVCWTVTRGSFCAEVGVQRFARARSGGDHRTHDLRIVANAGVGDTRAIDPEQRERQVLRWASASWGLGSVGLGALWLGSQGWLAGWAQLLLLLPAAAAWRATMAMLVQRSERNALSAAEVKALDAPRLADGLSRWRDLVPILRARRELLEGACGLPFRSPGSMMSIAGSSDAPSSASDAAASI